MSGIFISYRKEDTQAWAITLRDHLAREFGEGQIFLDLDSINAGSWRSQIEQALDRCRIVLVVIGQRWANATDAAGTSRLSQPDDVHRVEIATALSRPGVTVIPLLVDGARLPAAADLPDDLRGLLEQQARELGGAQGRRVADLQRLTDTIDAIAGHRRLRRRAIATLSAAIVAGLVNAVVRADSIGAAFVVLALAVGLTLVAWRTYGVMARDGIKGRWTALVAVILSSAMTLGSLIRLVARGL